ncbi:hypothetical protein V1477_007642 [Vespula maculifrons]|uniref:Uncharacterized protein n=1 Tax=Vespula maculifrons TaxID=7453 RepID=A0ABD2CGG8_VESMC
MTKGSTLIASSKDYEDKHWEKLLRRRKLNANSAYQKETLTYIYCVSMPSGYAVAMKFKSIWSIQVI